MERNKSDKYSIPARQQHQQLGRLGAGAYHLPVHENSRQQMFMQYASSIIQVVSEERLEQSQQGGQDPHSGTPLIEISEVNHFQQSSLSPALRCAEPILGQPFRKKRTREKLLAYNFTNFSILAAAVSKVLGSNLKTGLVALKGAKNQHRRDLIPPLKGRSSVHSGSTSCTAIDEGRSRRFLEGPLRKPLQQQQLKEGANAIKGWIEFKVLMIQSGAMKELRGGRGSLSRDQLSPIAGSRGENNFSEQFCLTDYQNEHSVSIEPLIHNFEESLAYTNDKPFDNKDYTMTTPDKLSTQGGQTNSKEKFQSVLPSSQPRESMVSSYKAHLKGSKVTGKSHIFEQKQVQQSPAMRMCSLQERRYLTIRTNLYEMPLISEHDLRHCQHPCKSEVPLKVDCLAHCEPQLLNCSSSTILKQAQTSARLFQHQPSSTPIDHHSTKQSLLPASKAKTEASQDYQHITQTCKIKHNYLTGNQQDTKSKGNHLTTHETPRHSHAEELGLSTQEGARDGQEMAGWLTGHERQAPLKIQNYYFPGRKTVKVEKGAEVDFSARNKLDEVKQVDSIISSVKKNQNLRIEESLVDNFPIPEEPKPAPLRSNLLPLQNARHCDQPLTDHPAPQRRLPQPNFLRSECKDPNYLQQQNKMRAHLSPQSPQPSFPLGGKLLHSNARREQPLRSPQANSPSRPFFPQSNPVLPVQQQYGTARREAECSSSRDRHLQRINFSHNLYQINQPSSSRVPQANFQSPRGQPQPLKTSQGRPVSRLLSPQSPSVQQQPAYGPGSREASLKKQSFFSPQTKDNYGILPSFIKYQVEEKNHNNGAMGHTQNYYPTQALAAPRMSDKALNFNNRYYCTGTIERPAPPPPPPVQHGNEGVRAGRGGKDRPHSCSRQSLDRFHLVSTLIPSQSELCRSGQGNSSREHSLGRPRSMNQKIHVTIFRDR